MVTELDDLEVDLEAAALLAWRSADCESGPLVSDGDLNFIWSDDNVLAVAADSDLDD